MFVRPFISCIESNFLRNTGCLFLNKSCVYSFHQNYTRTLKNVKRSFSSDAVSHVNPIKEKLRKEPKPLNKRPYYLDYQATTPVDPRVLDAMLPFYVDMYGNPHSRSHSFGWEAEHFVEEARKQVADLIGANSREIIFTSGATESNNVTIKGISAYYNRQGHHKNHIVTTQIEHKCVLASCRDVQDQFGWSVTYLPVKSDGIIDLHRLEEAITPHTALVSVMFVNNEIGVIQPIKEIGEICRKKGVLFHTDAAQAAGKLEISLHDMNIDLMSISGHKMYAPKGIGAVAIRQSRPRIRLVPIISGGGQERGIRSGTLPAPLIVAFGKAARIAKEELHYDNEHVVALAKRLQSKIMSNLDKVTLNGSPSSRYYGNLNLSFEAVEGESLLMSLKNVALSSGSACTSASLEPSYVLRAVGVGEDLAHTSLRFGFGRFTTVQEVDECAEAIIKHVRKLREMSPLWMEGETESLTLHWT